EARGRLLGFHPRDFDLWCRMYPCQVEVMQVALLGDPVDKLDLLTGQRLCQAINDRSFDLVLRAHGVHDLAADITGHPHLVNRNVAFDHTRLDDFSEVTLMAEIEAESLGPPGLLRLARPVGGFDDLLNHIPRATRIKRRTAPITRR